MEELKDQIKVQLEKIERMINENEAGEKIEKEREELDKYLLAYIRDLEEKK